MNVYSMSQIWTWLRCRKKYQYQYIMNREGTAEAPALEKGTALHSHLERACKGLPLEDDGDDMYFVAKEYLKHNALPIDIRYVESPFYFLIAPDTYIRCTADLVHVQDGVCYIRDWKSFSRAPSYNHELDFQAKTYAALFSTITSLPVIFEHVYIRTTPPGVPHNKKGDEWTPEECYITPTPVMFSSEEMESQREDVIDAVQEIQSKVRYRRSPLKGGGYDACDRCSVSTLCRLESYKGSLSEAEFEYHSKPNTRALEKHAFDTNMKYNLEEKRVSI